MQDLASEFSKKFPG